MPGLPDKRRDHLRIVIRESRRIAEEAYENRFKILGLWIECSRRHPHTRDCYVTPDERLSLLSDAVETRAALETAVKREEVGFLGLTAPERAQKAVVRLVRGAAFTLLNRLSALRAMEVRSLVDETVIRRTTYGGRSLREYRLVQAHPESPPDQLLERTLGEGFAEAAREIGAIFDAEDPYGLLLPDPRTLRELLGVFGEEITEADWKADDILGWIYQYYQDEARKAFRAGRGRGQRRAADADELAAINCLYTPHWVVRVLVDNSLGRFLLERQGRLSEAAKRVWSEEELRDPSGETVAQFCRYLVPSAEVGSLPPSKDLREIRVLDPACGSGHFLIYAFDVLWRAYREAEPEIPPAEHAATILELNLFGIDIDLRACQLAALGLYLKAKEYAPAFRPRALNVVCADVRILDGQRREAFLRRLSDDPGLLRIAERLLQDLRYTAETGSLLRVREPFEVLFHARRQRTTKQASLEEGRPEQLQLEGVIPKEQTIEEIFEAIHDFEREGVKRSDMGSRLFAVDAERSLGLLSLLSRQYDVIVMNPPYNKRQELPPATRSYLSDRYLANSDVYAAMIEQAVDLLAPHGLIGMLTPRGYMYHRQFQPLREILVRCGQPELVMEFGLGVPSDASVRTAASVLRRTPEAYDPPSDRRPRLFLDVTGPRGSEAKQRALVRAALKLRGAEQDSTCYFVSPHDLVAIPGQRWTYWLPGPVREAFLKFPPLDRDNAQMPEREKIGDAKVGLQTGDDRRFLRYWWEVPLGQLGQGAPWSPFVKGEEYSRWYQDPSLVVLWERNGAEIRNSSGAVVRNEHFYFREGLTWQYIADFPRRARYLPRGCIFGHGSRCVFLAQERHERLFALLAVLNSSLVNLAMLALTPERRWEVGELSLLPIAPRALDSTRLSSLAQELHDLLTAWDTGEETSSRYISPRLLQIIGLLAERPKTGHPLAESFVWPTWKSWEEIASLAGSRQMDLKDLLAVLHKRHDRFEARVAELEEHVDREVFRCYDLEDEASAILVALNRRLGVGFEDEAQEEATKGAAIEPSDNDGEEVQRLLSYYAKRAIETAPQPIVPLDPHSPGNLFATVQQLLRADWGEARSSHLEDEIHNLLGLSLEEWLIHEYFPLHVRLYRNRPVFWLLWADIRSLGRGCRVPAFACFLDYRRITGDTLRVVRGRLLARALDEAQADAERLGLEATEARIGGARDAIRLRKVAKAAEEAQAKVGVLEQFDLAIASIIERKVSEESPEEAPRLQQMAAEICRSGYVPDIKLGVLVNITPLRDAGVLHPAADRVR
jgi:hypothetical protein